LAPRDSFGHKHILSGITKHVVAKSCQRWKFYHKST